MILGLSLTAITGLFLFAFGFRGKRINEHPVCRACAFDLSDLYPAMATCPECGAGLQEPRAVRKGQRTWRKAPMAIGLLLLLVSGGIGGALGWGRATNFDFNRIKPMWLLVRDARTGTPGAVDAVANELTRRLDAGELDTKQIESAVRAVLEIQADPDRQWRTELGVFVETADHRGVLNAASLERYLRQAVIPQLQVRKFVRTGDLIPIELRLGRRTGNQSLFTACAIEVATRLDMEHQNWELDLPVGSFYASLHDFIMPGATTTELGPIHIRVAPFPFESPRSVLPDLPPGRGTIRSRWLFGVWRTTGRSGSGMSSQNVEFSNSWANARWKETPPHDVSFGDHIRAPQISGKPIVAWRAELFDEVNIVATNESLIQSVPDANIQRELTNLLEIEANTRPSRAGQPPRAGGSLLLNSPLPCNIAFDVYWRFGETENPVGHVWAPTEAYDRQFSHDPGRRLLMYYGNLPEVPPQTIDIILRSSPEAASRTVFMKEIWEGEIVIEGVQVDNQ